MPYIEQNIYISTSPTGVMNYDTHDFFISEGSSNAREKLSKKCCADKCSSREIQKYYCPGQRLVFNCYLFHIKLQ